MKRFLRPGWIIVYVLVIWGLVSWFWGGSIELNKTLVVNEGESIAESSLYEDMSFTEKIRLKRYFGKHEEDLKSLQPGSYVFSGGYSSEEIFEIFMDGPTQTYNHITVLEGWSSYDIDATLAEEGYIDPGEYRDFIQNQEIIDRYAERYEFIRLAQEERDISSLEGYLYPSTYYVEPEANTVDQLVYLQLEAFKKNIWEPYGEQLQNLSTKLSEMGYEFRLTTYGAIILASIVEKEERVPANRPEIASIFYNRLNAGMRLDADITLCYGLGYKHTECTPSAIGINLRDGNNPYNTRAVGGLPPTPIASVTESSVSALLEAQASDNYYYLHDSTGQLHTAGSLSEHNQNKSKYIR